ncbi:hypothetical protein G9A89_000121 [Geosiphon pyriformis]|nr:hypothetical protein G9A89_000121 [Geosiphon pyriformis]
MSKKKVFKDIFHGSVDGFFSQKKRVVLGNIKYFGDKKNVSLIKSEFDNSMYFDVDSLFSNNKDIDMSDIHNKSFLGLATTTSKVKCVNTNAVVKIHFVSYCMDDYLYLPQQLEEHFKAHNKNDLDFIELNPLPSCLICFPIEKQSTETYIAYTTYYFDQAYFKDNFEERNNNINQLLYSAIFEQQPSDFEYLNHQIHIWIAAHQATETPFETEEESYQTAPVFDLLSSKSDSSIQTITFEPIVNDLMQANILAALQDIQTALGRRNNTPLPLFRNDAQDLIEWLDDFERAATANQYDEEYKFQIIGGYFQGSPAIWFLQETDANAQH